MSASVKNSPIFTVILLRWLLVFYLNYPPMSAYVHLFSLMLSAYVHLFFLMSADVRYCPRMSANVRYGPLMSTSVRNSAIFTVIFLRWLLVFCLNYLLMFTCFH